LTDVVFSAPSVRLRRGWLRPIELFFRWVKQTLKLRHFLGTSFLIQTNDSRSHAGRCWATAQPTKQEPVGWTVAERQLAIAGENQPFRP
jgi:hypothetical protein